jgi:adenylate cyclase
MFETLKKGGAIMVDEGFKRKLTAILSADVAGYSRLMAEDETTTVKTIASYREIMSSLIKQHRGRVVDSPGDNVLAEFSSVVDAVQCAVAVQNEIQTRNAELPDNRRMEFRIGINLGDVIDEDGRIYGDGVNISARLEALADPGGICVSKTAFDQIETKLPLGYEYLGEQSVKNIPKPVGAYRVLMKPDAAGKVIGEKRFLGRYSRRTAMGAIIILAIVAVGLVSWNIYLQQSKKIEPASVEKMAFPLPDKPSIAVLPFDNMSGDPEQEYLGDGLTEEIISALSKLPKLFVIARHSTFTYKEKTVKLQQVSEELGVRYVLEGSVRKDKDRVRITAQLADAISGRHLWSERYDRDLKDIFALQDEITMKIINALQVELTEGQHARLWGKGTENLQAYLKTMQAREHFFSQTKEGTALAKRLAEEAIALDPAFAPSYHVLSRAIFMDIVFKTTKSPKQSIARAVELAQKTIALDDSYALGYGWLGLLYTILRKHEKGIIEAQKGVALDPNGAHNYFYLNWTLRYAGRFDEAVQAIEKALRLNPFPPVTHFRAASMSYIGAGRYEEAIAAAKKAVTVAPNDHFSHEILSAAFILDGREEEARSAAEEVLRLNPNYSLNFRKNTLPFKKKEDLQQYYAALQKAGLPE